MWSSFTNDEKKLLVSLLAVLAFGSVVVPYVKSARETRVFPAASVPGEVTSSSATARADKKGSLPAGQLDLNTATAELLECLPGVGPSRARDIIQYRDTHGGFRSVSDLDNVKGIGPSTLAQLSPLVTIQAAPAATSAAGPPITPAAQRAVAVSVLQPTPSRPKLVNINTATVAELEMLDHIGPAIASRIVQYRSMHGPFPTVDSLVNVTGIGPKTLADIRYWITVH